MSEPQPSSIALGLAGLRSYISVCCWITVLALAIQILVWSLAAFTNVRYSTVDRWENQEVVTKAPAKRLDPESQTAQALPASVLDAIEPGPIQVRTRWDQLFNDLSALSLAAGSLALVVVILLLVVGVNLMTASAMSGVEKAISALIWAIIIAVVALPASEVVNMPWKGSALRAYEVMVNDIETAQSLNKEDFGFFASSLLMPAMCLLGMFLINFRFLSAVAHCMPESHPFLDPSLEEETSGRRASSLHGSRAAGALQRLVDTGEDKELASSVAAQIASKPSEQAPSCEENLRRII
ncbi:MAG: hypothetical protein ACYTGC_02525 [Planctomycetota bacterium]|jgi:hypothetical protein